MGASIMGLISDHNKILSPECKDGMKYLMLYISNGRRIYKQFPLIIFLNEIFSLIFFILKVPPPLLSDIPKYESWKKSREKAELS